ncbi:hypothetical protein BC828DRAFT_391168, partial [Blastocladiella britannica]
MSLSNSGTEDIYARRDPAHAAAAKKVKSHITEGGKQLELCHFSLSAFPTIQPQVGIGLRKIVIVAQDIDRISNSLAESCPNLEALWICETQITRVEQLAHCVQLKELYLYSNQITSIRPLAGLCNLVTLWVNDNALTDISCLSECVALENLNAANNSIADIDRSILTHVRLKTLNVAGNAIYLLSAIETLGWLEELTELVLEHSFFGSNPVCALQNYELLTLCHCTNLSKLNEKWISEQHVDQALSAQKKKRRHYEIKWQSRVTDYLGNMRYLRDRIGRMAPAFSCVLGYLDWSEHHSKHAQSLASPSSPPSSPTIGSTSAPARALALHDELLASIKSTFDQITHEYLSLIADRVRLSLEFETLGSVSFSPASKGMLEALGVMPTRYVASTATQVLQISLPFTAPSNGAINVMKVVPDRDVFIVTQGHLPICCFHEALLVPPQPLEDTGVEQSTATAAPHFHSREYVDARVARQQQLAARLDTCALRRSVEIDLSHMLISTLPVGVVLPSVLVVKLAFNSIFDIKQVFDMFPSAQRIDLRHNQIARLVDQAPASLQAIDLSGNAIAASSLRVFHGWCTHLDECIADEYLLDAPCAMPFDYLLFPPANVKYPQQARGGSHLVRCPMPMDMPALNELIQVSQGLKNIKYLSLRNCGLTAVDPLARISTLEHLYLGGNSLTNIDPLGYLPCLTVLDVASNYVERMSEGGTPSAPHPNAGSADATYPPSTPGGTARAFSRVQHLNVTANRMTSLEFLRWVPKLQELYAGHNLLADAGQMTALALVTSLLVLDLRGNPLTVQPSAASYRATAIYCAPSVQVLDGEAVTDEQAAGAKQMLVGCLTKTKLVEKIVASRTNTLTCLDLRACGLQRIECFAPGEFPHLAFVNLDHNQLSDASNLLHLRSLRCLSLSGNRFESLPDPSKVLLVATAAYRSSTAGGAALGFSGPNEGMTPGTPAVSSFMWPVLAELYLDHNHIKSIADLYLDSVSSELRILSLRSNRLPKIDGVERVKTLQKLHVDGNQLRAIDMEVASGMRSLKELSI